jgi:hypothetical protein
MMPDEYEITLIVKGDDLTALKLGIVRKERPQEAPHALAQACPEAMQIEFWNVIGWSTVLG